jgi:hypothetical protein
MTRFLLEGSDSGKFHPSFGNRAGDRPSPRRGDKVFFGQRPGQGGFNGETSTQEGLAGKEVPGRTASVAILDGAKGLVFHRSARTFQTGGEGLIVWWGFLTMEIGWAAVLTVVG